MAKSWMLRLLHEIQGKYKKLRGDPECSDTPQWDTQFNPNISLVNFYTILCKVIPAICIEKSPFFMCKWAEELRKSFPSIPFLCPSASSHAESILSSSNPLCHRWTMLVFLLCITGIAHLPCEWLQSSTALNWVSVCCEGAWIAQQLHLCSSPRLWVHNVPRMECLHKTIRVFGLIFTLGDAEFSVKFIWESSFSKRRTACLSLNAR